MKKILVIAALFSTMAMGQNIIERNNFEPNIKNADEAAGCKVIVDTIDRNRDIAGAIAGGVIGGGVTARSLVGAALGAYMSRPSGGGRTGP
jgi:hypothetical protein